VVKEIKSVYLTNFKGFSKYRITFGGDAFLVGPNNAGKSTVIAAIRSVANMIRIASRVNAADSLKVDGFEQAGHWFNGDHVGLVEENLRHEFRQRETRLKVKFSNGARLEALWPIQEDGGFFFVLNRDEVNLMSAAAIREALPSAAIVPVLSPVDRTEELLSEKHVRANLDSRLASRHFRNQLRLLSQDEAAKDGDPLKEFFGFVERWTPELSFKDLDIRAGGGKTGLDLNYREPDSRIDKELFWAGDGMQIWIQLLLHLYRAGGRDVIVLDEPDVFLHADLQRRLVDLLETLDAQTITATHSAEVVGEADARSLIWISRNRRAAIRSPAADRLSSLSSALGTRVNLPLARALKTKVVVFVEGDDSKLLKNLSSCLGHPHIAKELGVTLISLGGFTRWEDVKPFKWLIDEFLEDRVAVHVLLDRDYRNATDVKRVEADLKNVGVAGHVWKWHEIENYLLDQRLLARVSGAPECDIEKHLADAAKSLESDFYAGIDEDESRVGRRKGESFRTFSKAGKDRADSIWVDLDKRLTAAPGKDILRIVNGKLQDDGHRAASARTLALNAKTVEVPQELRAILSSIESKAGIT
jgi:hypothetical protein